MTPCSYTSPWQPQLRPLAGRCSSRPSTWPGSCTCRSPSGTPCTGRPGPGGDGDTGDGGGDDDIAPCASNKYTAPCDSDDDTAPFDSDDGMALSDSDDDINSFGSDDDIAKKVTVMIILLHQIMKLLQEMIMLLSVLSPEGEPWP